MKIKQFLLTGILAGAAAMSHAAAQNEFDAPAAMPEITSQQVQEKLDSAGSFFNSMVNKASQGISKAADVAGDMAKNSSNALGEGMKSAGKGIQSLSERNPTEVVESVTRATGNFVGKGMKEAGQGLQKLSGGEPEMQQVVEPTKADRLSNIQKMRDKANSSIVPEKKSGYKNN